MSENVQAAEFVLRSESEWNAFALEIVVDPSKAFAHPIMVYVTADRVDSEAIKLSQAMPGAVIKLSCHARIRCTYQNGIRSTVRDMKDFYLYEEGDPKYAATKFQDTKTAEWI